MTVALAGMLLKSNFNKLRTVMGKPPIVQAASGSSIAVQLLASVPLYKPILVS